MIDLRMPYVLRNSFDKQRLMNSLRVAIFLYHNDISETASHKLDILSLSVYRTFSKKNVRAGYLHILLTPPLPYPTSQDGPHSPLVHM